MKSTAIRILSIFFVFILIFSFSGCVNSAKKQQQIMDTFSSFPCSDQYIMVTAFDIRVGQKVIDMGSITYDGAHCEFILAEQDGAYAYAYAPGSETSVNIVYVDYETLAVTLLTNVDMPSKVIATEHYNNKLYFRVDDPATEEFRQLYYTYDLATEQIQSVDTASLPYDIECSGDHNRSSVYKITSGSGALSNYLTVTKNETGETKTIDNSLLETCPEGKQILDLGASGLGTGCSTAYEKNGDIYVAFLYTIDGISGNPCYWYIMQYNFESHTLSYYTSVYFETYPEAILDLYIP